MPAFQGMVSVVAFLNSPRMKTKLSFVYKDFVQHKKLLIACCLLCVASVNWPFMDCFALCLFPFCLSITHEAIAVKSLLNP